MKLGGNEQTQNTPLHSLGVMSTTTDTSPSKFSVVNLQTTDDKPTLSDQVSFKHTGFSLARGYSDLMQDRTDLPRTLASHNRENEFSLTKAIENESLGSVCKKTQQEKW